MKLADTRLVRAVQLDDASKKTEFEEIIGLWQKAKKVGKYPERWDGALSYDIGYLMVVIGNHKMADVEFRASLAQMKKRKPPLPAKMKEAQDEMTKYLNGK